MLSRQSVWRYFDLWLIAAVLLLTVYGVLMIRSAVTGVAVWASFPRLQLQWMLIGIILTLIFAAIDYRYLTASHWYIYGGLVLFLIVVLITGAECNNTRRCVPIPGIDFNFQPTEFGRIFFVVTFAQFLSNRQERIPIFSNTVSSMLYVGVPVALIFIEPDLGMSILFLTVWFVMIWMAGLPVVHFIIIGVIGLVGLGLVFPQLEAYQQERIFTFVNPENADPDDLFNIEQAEISIGSGRLFGKGYLQGTQSQLGFLRVQHTDFIFSMLTEEMGLIFGSLIVLALQGIILWRILRAAMLTPDLAGRLICTGIGAVLFFQVTVNVGMNVRVLPVTGLTLPFVSYGGSSLITLYIAIGIVQSVLMRHRKQEFG